MHDTVIRGDCCNITISRYCFIDEGTLISPSFISPACAPLSHQDAPNSDVKYVPMQIGKYTRIGKSCVVQAASIGMGCHIGDNCVISNRVILKDHVLVMDDSVVAADFVAPPFAVVSGEW